VDQYEVNGEQEEKIFNRIAVATITVWVFEDAFRPISRDGASNVELMIRLQKPL
jgi:uncharacterized membrane protein